MNYQAICKVNNILVTGASGVLGGRLVLELLASTHATLYCLSRAANAATAYEKILKVVKAYDTEGRYRDEYWRIVPVNGDITDPRFALSDDDYQEFAQSIELVFHCAANVSLMATYEKLKPVNVDGVGHMISFCLKADAPMLFVSSYSVIGDKLYHECTLHESELDIEQSFEELGYERSKFDAEHLMHAATQQGLNWAIVRPGNIWGDSKTGAYPLFETRVKGIYYEMVKSLVDTGYTYQSGEDFDVTPVDYVAKASLFIALNIHQTRYRTYHLTNPEQISFNQLVGNIRDYGYTLRALNDEDYFGALYEDRMVVNKKPYRSTFTDILSIFLDADDLAEAARWDTTQAQALLEPNGIGCPQADAALFKTYLNYAVQREWIPLPEKQTLATITEEIENKIFMQHLYDEELPPIVHNN